ncbi:MAG: 16S rRNA (guanine(966)-N(2))-methyltransferase RsmD [Chloroflexi bacterium]|nr:16S rRNA (guanine(966)-N(2))-methyltransferase RsmD [Chloroflexota bacterium]
MSTRVIAGTAKGRRLKLVPGDTTRPIMDRVKEALFSILGRRVYDAQVLDLFAGTGAVGIEALSRGAAHCIFVDLERRAIDTIRDNLKTTGLAGSAEVRRANAFQVLSGPVTPCDVIYVAPPQYRTLWADTLHALDATPQWLAPGGVIVVQIDPKERAPIALNHFSPYDERRYGSTLLWFFQHHAEAAPENAEDSPS